MNMLINNIVDVENRHTSGAYSKRPLAIVRGSGSTVRDDEGNAYLDATSGMGVALLGYSYPAIVEAITAQAATLITCPEIFYNDRRADVYQQLSRILPEEIRRFFLCNSGTEAVEGALKAARLFTGRTGIVAAKRSFHGRTLGALGTTWNPHYRDNFEGWTISDITYTTYNDLSSAREAVTQNTAAVIVEAVQGEGGVYLADAAYLQGLRQLCDETGALLIIDEIQSGLGRTGRWFAFEHAGILPDIVTLGKGIASGIPMGAVCWRDTLGEIPVGTHGSTFGGNPLACAAASATLEVLITNQIPETVTELGAYLLERLNALQSPLIREVRGLGLMIGIQLRDRVTPVLQGLQERGVLALPAGKTVLRLLPPLIITRDEIDRIINALEDTLNDLSN